MAINDRRSAEVIMEHDERWKSWWRGPERPFLVLSQARFADPEFHRIAEQEYPGVLLIEDKMLPTR